MTMTEREQIEALRVALAEALDGWEGQGEVVQSRGAAPREARVLARIASLRRIADRGLGPGDYCYVCGRVGSHDDPDELSEEQRLAHVAEDASQHR